MERGSDSNASPETPGESDGHLQPVAKLTHEFCAGGNGPGDPQRLLDTGLPKSGLM